MHWSANDSYRVHALWKIGNLHYNDIKDRPRNYNYNLVSAIQFGFCAGKDYRDGAVVPFE